MAQTTCARMPEFVSCITKFNLDIANCSAKVLSVPDVEFYKCKCDYYTAMDKCYYICPEDAQIQLQFMTQKQSGDAECKAYQEMLLRSSSSAAATKTKTAIKTTTSLSIAPPPPTMTPSKPSGNPPNGGSSIGPMATFKVSRGTSRVLLFTPFSYLVVAVLVGIVISNSA